MFAEPPAPPPAAAIATAPPPPSARAESDVATPPEPASGVNASSGAANDPEQPAAKSSPNAKALIVTKLTNHRAESMAGRNGGWNA